MSSWVSPLYVWLVLLICVTLLVVGTGWRHPFPPVTKLVRVQQNILVLKGLPNRLPPTVRGYPHIVNSVQAARDPIYKILEEKTVSPKNKT